MMGVLCNDASSLVMVVMNSFQRFEAVQTVDIKITGPL